MYSIVTNLQIIQEVKKSKYFKMSLGYTATMPDNSGNRKNFDKDGFAFFYNNLYKTTIYGQGIIGDLHFYVDYYITDSKLAIYTEKNEEYILEFSKIILNEKGIDAYLGCLLKELDEKIEERSLNGQKRKEDEKKKANAEALFKNPGAVSYEDLKAFMDQKNKERYEAKKDS